jgi:hypothetical protein
MEMFATWLLSGILASLSALHLYWAAGGRRGSDASIPTSITGAPLFAPGPAAYLGVACALMFGAAIAVVPFDPWLKGVVLRAMALLFALRALGDFRYVGFSKRRSESPFAYWDTRFYSPLCVLVALLSATVPVA